MDFSDLFKVLTPAAIGAVFGYLAKTLIEHFLRLRSHRADKLLDLETDKAKRLDERIAYQSERFFFPFARSLERLASRLILLVGEKREAHQYTDYYLESTAVYELSAACYWVERPDADPRLVDALDAKTLDQIRETLRAMSGLPLYEQKQIARAMTQKQPDSFGPIAYGDFVQAGGHTKIVRLSTQMKARVSSRNLPLVATGLSQLALILERRADSSMQA